jgi:hypothetical protein
MAYDLLGRVADAEFYVLQRLAVKKEKKKKVSTHEIDTD